MNPKWRERAKLAGFVLGLAVFYAAPFALTQHWWAGMSWHAELVWVGHEAERVMADLVIFAMLLFMGWAIRQDS